MDPVGSPTPPSHLKVLRTDHGDGLVHLTALGEIDMTTGDEFRHELLAVLAEPDLRRLLIDVGALTFMDSHAVAVLIRAHQTAEERGVGFAVTHTNRVIRSILEMLGVHTLLTADATQP